MADNELLSQIRLMIEEVIEEKIKPINDDISGLMDIYNRDLRSNYLNSVARLLEKEAHALVDSFRCSYHPQTGSQCKTWVKEHVSLYAKSLEVGDFPHAFSLLEDFLRVSQNNINDVDKSSKCAQDWAMIYDTLRRHYEFVKDLGNLIMDRPIPTNIQEQELDEEAIYSAFISPLSHPIRIKIISSLARSSKRFTVLKKELGVKNTGLLVHHLKPLTETGIIAQYLKKEYYLTDLGHAVSRVLLQAQIALSPSQNVRLQVKPMVQDMDMVDERPKIKKTLHVIND